MRPGLWKDWNQDWKVAKTTWYFCVPHLCSPLHTCCTFLSADHWAGSAPQDIMQNVFLVPKCVYSSPHLGKDSLNRSLSFILSLSLFLFSLFSPTPQPPLIPTNLQTPREGTLVQLFSLPGPISCGQEDQSYCPDMAIKSPILELQRLVSGRRCREGDGAKEGILLACIPEAVPRQGLKSK